MAKRQKRAQKKEKTCLLVLGMHRSGTLALTGMLSQLGCDLPESLMQPSPRNEKGFFESVSIRDFNQEVLKSAGTSWDGYEAVNEGWLTSPVARKFHERALDVLQQQFGSSPFFALKDPRICRMLPFWRGVLEDFDCEVKPILTVRQPMEVAASLKARDNCDVAMGQMIWLRHVLEAERQTRGVVRFHTSYDSLLANWAMVANQMQDGLGFSWPTGLEQVAGNVSKFLTPDLRHHLVASNQIRDDPLVNVWVRTAYDVLRGWAEHGENAEDYTRLDTVLSEFNTAVRGFRSVVQEEQSHSADLQAAKDVLEREHEEASETIRVLRKKHSHADAQRVETETALEQLRLEHENLSQTAQVQAEELKESQAGAEQLRLDHERQVDRLNAELLQSRETLQAVRADADRDAERLERAEAERDDLRSQLQQLESAVKQRQQEVDDTLAQLADQQAHSALLEQKTVSLKENLQTALNEQKTRAKELADLRTSSGAEITALKETVSERFRELAELTKMLQEDKAAMSRDRAELVEVKRKLHHERDRRAVLRGEVDTLLQERDQRQGEMEALRGEREHFEHEVDQLRNSTSWKITAPVRRVVRLLRGQ